MLKKGFVGVYHKISRKHLQRYIDKYVGRHNNKPLYTIIPIIQLEKVIEGLEAKRLKYADLIG